MGVILSLQVSFILSRFLMNCLKIDPNLLKKRIDTRRRDFNYTCLDMIKEYNLPVEIYYDYFSSLEEFKLKNLWNHIIIKWNQMKYDIRENNDFIKSEYSNDEYHQIHKQIDDTVFNDLLIDFINDHHLKYFFVCNSIQNTIISK